MAISISTRPEVGEALAALRSAAGAWRGTHDPEELKKRIYADRLVSTRPKPRL